MGRCDQYIRSLDYEAASHVPEHAPPADWPQRGGLELREVCLRYRPDLPRVLHSVSLLVRPAEKLGVVGRTGAGQWKILGPCTVSLSLLLITGPQPKESVRLCERILHWSSNRLVL